MKSGLYYSPPPLTLSDIISLATLSNSGPVVRFDSFELDLRSGELRQNGASVKLQPQPAKLLALLVSRAGQVVSREELVGEVWGSETFVDYERGLNFAIRQIRSVLGDDADQPRFLETLPRRGYRFIASVQGEIPVAVAEPPSPRSFGPRVAGLVAAFVLCASAAYFAWQHFQPRVPLRPIVMAVLPFDDLSSQPQAFLVEGLTEEMVARVTQISPEHLKVIARTSAMQYEGTKKSARQIGEELGADYVLENSIRHEGGRLRITSQLVRTSDQTHLWAENYDRDMRDLLLLESEVTSGIAEQIQMQLLPAVVVNRSGNGRPVDPEAHELYLKGRYAFNQRSRESLQQSIAYFQQAVAKQPDYAIAYAGLADAYNLTAYYGFDPTQGGWSQAKIASTKALQLDDSLGAAHAALAYTEFLSQEDWAAAEKEFRRALELDDNYVPAHHWYAFYLAANGRMGESLSQMRYAQKLDPLSPAVHAGLAYMEYFARDYEQAVQQAKAALQLNPNSMAAHAVMGWTYTEQKKYPDAFQELQTAGKLSGGSTAYLCGLARAYALSGNSRQAEKMLGELETMQKGLRGAGTGIAAIYLALGNSEKALYWIEHTAPGDLQANWLRVDPAFDGLRQNRRFAAVVARIGTTSGSSDSSR
jgi:TolB-like protein/DNA-binding winged helix-turn-helix (wHTH) protein/Flp pilus assembly protein TadD